MTRVAYRFSVVIPSYGRVEALRDCLRSLTQLDYPRSRFEVIVVDDGSPDLLDRTVHACRDGLNLTLLRKKRDGPAAARNAGVEVARGEYVAFTDDDCRVSSDWLEKLESRLDQDPDRMVGGRVVNHLSDNHYAVTSQIILDAVYAYHDRVTEHTNFFASNNMAMRKTLFYELGGFDTSFPLAAAEDRDLCDRWRFAGHRMTYERTAVVFHMHELTFRGFCRQHFNYGRGAYHYHQLRAQRGSGRLASDMMFHAHLPSLLREPLSGLSPARIVSVGTLLGLWQLVNAAGFFFEKIVTPATSPSGSADDRATLARLGRVEEVADCEWRAPKKS